MARALRLSIEHCQRRHSRQDLSIVHCHSRHSRQNLSIVHCHSRHSRQDLSLTATSLLTFFSSLAAHAAHLAQH
jgi:hypothetical protein